MTRQKWFCWAAVAALALGLNTSAQAQESSFDIGFRLNGLGGDGKPTNDILGYGINFRYQLNERWWVGFGIDQSDEFDVEGPAEFVGLPADFSAGVDDAKGTSTLLTAWIERTFERTQRFEWFLTAGVGFNLVDIDPISGALIGGGTYRLVTDADDELVLSFSAGCRWRMGQRWQLEVAARGDQHLADWTIVDEISGATGSQDDYFIRGLTLGLRYRF